MRQRMHRMLLALVLVFVFLLCGFTKEEYAFDGHLTKVFVFDCFFRKGLLPELAPGEFLRLVTNGEIESMSLTIYYMHPPVHTWGPVWIDHLIGWCGSEGAIKSGEGGIVVVEGIELAKYTVLLSLLSKEELVLDDQDNYMNARIYYVFKDKYRRTLLEVALWGYDRYGALDHSIAVYTNGIYVEDKDIYYDIIIPFLPDRVSSILERWKPSSGKRPQ